MPMLKLVENGKLIYSTNEFLEAWKNNTEILSIRNEANVFRSEICSKCNLWALCNCGCPLTWGYFSPEDYISDELLEINEKMIFDWTIKKYNP